MGSAADFIKEARKHVGLGEPNFIQSWYRRRNGSAYSGNFAWCDAYVTYCAYQSGNHQAVCHGTDYAYTVAHAERFRKHGEWHDGTSASIDRCKPGDVVFFDWGGSNSIGAIDHVGIVLEALGNGNVRTIEGNTSNQCLIKVRNSSVLAGYGRPKFSSSEMPSTNDGMLEEGEMGEAVKSLQRALNAKGAKPALEVDGDFGPMTKKAVKGFQKFMKLEVDGIVGPITKKALGLK